MNNKLLAGIILTVLLIFAIIGKLMIFDDAYIAKVNIEDNYKYNISKDLRLVPLDYMNKKEVSFCKDLKKILSDNKNNTKFFFAKQVASVEELYQAVKSKCSFEEFAKVIPSGKDYEYSFYKTDDEEYLSVKTPNLLNIISAMDKNSCKLDDVIAGKSLIVSENAMVGKIDGKYYLISEWFAPDKFVFYYLDRAHKYNGVICRFDVKKD